MGAVVLMTLGVLFLLENFRVYDLDFDHTWPLLLISIGVTLMLQRTASTDGHVQPPAMGQPFPMPPAPPAPPMPGQQPSESSSEVRHE
jgi:hypothetical protein